MFNAKLADKGSWWCTQGGDKVMFDGITINDSGKKRAQFIFDDTDLVFHTKKNGLVPGAEHESHINDIIGPWDIKPLSKPNVEFKTFDPDEPVHLLKEIVLTTSICVVLVGGRVTQSFHTRDASEKAMEFAKKLRDKYPAALVHLATITAGNLLNGAPLIQKISI